MFSGRDGCFRSRPAQARQAQAISAVLRAQAVRSHICLRNGTRVPFTPFPRPRIYSSPLFTEWDECLGNPILRGSQSGRSMKNSKRRPSGSGLGRAARERDVQHEIKSFLNALVTYPDRFALEPDLSFEQHLFQQVATKLANGEGHRRS